MDIKEVEPTRQEMAKQQALTRKIDKLVNSNDNKTKMGFLLIQFEYGLPDGFESTMAVSGISSEKATILLKSLSDKLAVISSN